jgi:spoIIIJ-associated protein
MAGVEASGKTIEEAIENALEELDADRDEVHVEVLAEPKKGGILRGGSEARVRVWLLDDEDAPQPGNIADPASRAPESDDEAEEEGEPLLEGDEPEDEEDDAEFAAQMLDHLLELMAVQADVSIRDAETPGDGLGMAKAVLDVEGDDLGILIGRRGETLASLQYLLNLMVTRQLGQHSMFTVDVEGYRRRRERQLTQLARRMADQAIRTGRPAELEPMPPNERRIIHLALSNDRRVTTASDGEGEDRAVSITPRRDQR